MSITNKINEIIDRRIGRNGFEGKGHLESIKKKKEFFDGLKHVLDEYYALREIMLSQIKDKRSGEYYTMSLEDPTLQQKIESADPSAVILQLNKCLEECDRLEQRFNRDSINISVVGRARQGKSLLLQSISGLPDEVIPASNGGDCTGAKSVIANAPGGKTHARIEFYNEVEMVEQIQKYLDEIGVHHFIGSLAEVTSLVEDLDDFAKGMKSKTGRQQSLYQHLRKYVDHYNDYNKYVGTVKDESDEKMIRKYVAQYDSKMLPTYAYLAVKEVKIFTEFPTKDAGKIVLVDTIGLGDTSLGIRDKMIRTLRNDSDAAILVRLPAANGDSIRVEDDELYDLICNAMGTEALGKWLFFALNVCDALGNHNSGNAMEEALNERKLNFAFIKKTNCGDPVDVEKNLLIPILEYLSSNLADVDNNLIVKANEIFTDCYQKYFDLCSKVDGILSGGLRKTLQSGGLFDELYDDKLGLPRQLKQLMDKYALKDKNGEACDSIVNSITSIIRNIASHCPSQDMIRERLSSGGEKSHAPNVYLYYADNLRAVIRDEFEEINRSTVTLLQDDFKKEVCEVLADDNGGRLGRIPIAEFKEKEMVTWLKTLCEDKLDGFPLVAEAFNDIVDYRLNIEGFLEYKIDEAMECLDYSPQNDKFVMPDFKGLSNDEIAFLIEQSLQNTIPTVADDIIEGIQELLRVPYHSFRARVRKLYDRLIMKEQGNRELKNFYRENAMALWPKEFSAIANKEYALGKLNDCGSALKDKRVKDLFIINLR